jgi:hypothetical protein
MMNKKVLSLWVVIILQLLFLSPLTAQKLKSISFVQDYREATLLMEEGHYDKARAIWQKLVRTEPENQNLNFKLGQCYLMSEFFRPFALKPLKLAVSDISKRYDPFNELESSAPKETYYFLALAYHLNEDFEEAEKYYQIAQKSISKRHKLGAELDENFRRFSFAKNAYQSSLSAKVVPLTYYNSRFKEGNPVFHSAGESFLYSSNTLRADSSNLNVYNPNTGERFSDIYLVNKNRLGFFEAPILLTKNKDYDSAPNDFLNEENLMFSEKLPNSFEVFLATIQNENLTEERKQYGALLPRGITHPDFCVHPNGKLLYYSALHIDNKGELDIFVSKFEDGVWSKGINLGRFVNSERSEKKPWITPDGKRLYFASNGFYDKNMGGFDIFYVNLTDEGLPVGDCVNMGYPANTVLDEIAVSVGFNYQDFIVVSNRNKVRQYELFKSEETKPYMLPDSHLKIMLSDANFNSKNLFLTTPDYDTVKPLSFNNNLIYLPNAKKGEYVLSNPNGKTHRFSFTEDKVNNYIAFVNKISGELILRPENERYWYWQFDSMPLNSFKDISITYNKEEIFAVQDNVFPYFPYPEKGEGSKIKLNGVNPDFCANANLFLVDENGMVLKRLPHQGNCSYFDDLEKLQAQKPSLKLKESNVGGLKVSNFYGVNQGADTLKPQTENLTFFSNFEYNVKGGSAVESAMFKAFIYDLAELLADKTVKKIVITGSASKVPTARFNNNQELANLRAKNLEKAIISGLSALGVTLPKDLLELQGLVQGPEYNSDAQQNIEVYKKYQFSFVEVIKN